MRMEAKLTFAKKIGNFISNILLGETKEMIVRMDEHILNISKRVENIEDELKNEIRPALRNIDTRLAVVEDRLGISSSK